MKIRKVDDKPMVIHTKEKAKIHAHEPKGAKIKGSNIYTVERGPKTIGAKVSDDKKKSYRKSTIHQSEPKNKGLSRFKRNLKESNTSIKTKNTNLHIAGRTGALAAGAVTEQVEGGHEVSQAAYLAYESSRPVTGTASKGAALFRKKAAAEAKKRIKKVETGKKLAKKTAKKAAKDTAKAVAKETAKETATADEDRMVTQAEYGAEIEAETTEKDPSELQYITPIDYAKRIAELDEDLRDAAEILVTDCSCYTPFRAFLMDVVQSDFAFMPNKLDLIRDIALGTDNAERKAYSNNKYGLVEYSIRSGYVKISYKNRNGVRKEGALDWRELYEILSYMVKQPFYCGEDQKKYYQETKQKADRDKMNPVYKRFFDIEDSVKANRLETRERAIANGWNTKIDENGRIMSDNVEPASVDVSDDLHRDDSQRESTEESQLQDETELAVADNQKKHNFHYNLWELEKGGAKTRYQWNIDAIRTLKQSLWEQSDFRILRLRIMQEQK